MLPCGNIFAATTTAVVNNPTSTTMQSAAGSSHPAWQVRRGIDYNSGTRLTQALTPGATANFANTVVTNGETWTLFQEFQNPTTLAWSWVSVTNQIISGNVFPETWLLQGINTETNCNYSFAVQNNSTAVQLFFAMRNGVIDMTKTINVNPGASGTLSFTAPCNESAMWKVAWAPYGEPFDLDIDPQVVPVTANPTNIIPILITPNNPTPYNATNQNPIYYTGTNDTQEGFGAVYDAITKFAAQNDANLRALRTNSSGGTSVSVSNNFSVSVTNINSGGETGIVDAINSFHNSFTNGTGTGILSYQTNSAEVQALAESVINPSVELIDGAISDLGDAPTILDGGSPDMTINFMGQDLNLDPNVWLPGAMPLLKGLITLIATVFFSIHCSKLVWEATRTYASAQTGGVPNIEGTIFGIGGNVAGATLATVIPGIFILVWVAVFYWLFTTVVGNLSDMGTAASGVALGNSTALYLLNSVFPISLLLTFAWTKVALYLGASKVVMLAATISRYLFGK